MFSRSSHPYIQIDDSYLDSPGNPDYDTSSQKNDGIPLRQISKSGSLKRHAYKALETPSANLDTPDSPSKSPSGSSSRPPSDIFKPLPKAPLPKWSGWRFTVASGSLTTTVILIFNIALLGWSYRHEWSDTGNLLLYRGDCNEMKKIDTWSHFAINLLSTLLLGASNYAMQVLGAPTRKNIDEAHPKGGILEIGISGFGNWRYMGWKRRGLWIALTTSTIPLHLLYNSVIFSTTSAVNYNAFVVTSTFTNSGFNNSNALLDTLHSKAINGSLTNITTSDCYPTFNTNYIADYANVVLVTNVAQNIMNDSLLAHYEHDSRSQNPDLGWLCDYHYDCTVDPADWTYSYESSAGTTATTATAKVDYCLGESVEPKCTIELIPALLITVIACNIVKGLAFIYLAFLQFDPLITIGQAIASFLENPDPTTVGLGAHSAKDVRGHWISNVHGGTYWSELNQDHIYKPERRRWFSGASPMRWVLTILACFFYWIVGLICLIAIQFSDGHPSFASQWSAGFGAIIPSAIKSITSGVSQDAAVLGDVLIANLPQLVLSLVYVAFNGLFTCMLLSREWVSFARFRKGLRVHWPQGAQRATYWLSLPYRYSLPLLIASGLLHWLLSQSIFVAQINVFSSDDPPAKILSLNAIGWSGLALTLLLALGGTMILTLLGFGFLHYSPGIPVSSSNSRAISAACHPLPGKFNESTKRLQYGVIAELDDGKYRVGFSSEEVKPLVAGDHYE